MTLVQRAVLDRRDVRLAKLLENQIERVLRADQSGGEADAEQNVELLQLAAGAARLFNAERRQIRVFPAGEKIFGVPLALAVANQNESAIHARKRSSISGAGKAKHVGHGVEPGVLPRVHSAAASAPRANTPRSSARCENSMRSPDPAKTTV